MARVIGLTVLLILILPFVLSGCRSKCVEGSKDYPECLGKDNPNIVKPTVTLTFWNLYDDKEVFKGAIQQFEKKPRDDVKVKINYQEFTNEEKYEEYLMSKLAEGDGPDIFAMHYSWLPRHQKKIAPMPESTGMNPEIFRNTFQDVAAKVLIRKDEVAGLERIYGLPLYIDTLALYYNKNLFKLLLPEDKNKPGETWEEIKAQVVHIKQEDPNSLERFKVTGIAMGRSDNIRHAVDILSMLFLQEGVELVDSAKKKITLNEGDSAKKAMELFKSFEYGSTSIQENWNQLITALYPKEQELGAFVRGKVGMIFGFSTTYQELEDLITAHEKERGGTPIKSSDIGIIEVPQPKSQANRDEGNGEFAVTLADFYPLTVSASSSDQKRELAWEFLHDIATDENFLKKYNEMTHKPSAMINGVSDEQKRDKLFGVFSRQIQYAKTLPIMNKQDYTDIFSYAISKAITKGVSNVLKRAGEQMQCVLEIATETSKTPDTDCTEIE